MVLGLSIYFYKLIFTVSPANLGFLVFVILFNATTYLYCKYKNNKINPKCYIFISLAVLLSIPLVITDMDSYGILNRFSAALCSVLALAFVSSTTIKNDLGDYLSNDLVNLFIYRPFCNFMAFLKSIFKVIIHAKTLIYSVLSFIGTVVLVSIVCSLLGAADEGFRVFIQDLCISIDFNFFEIIPIFLITCYLFGLFFSSVTGRKAIRTSYDKLSANRKRIISKAPAFIPLGSVITIYFIFIVMHINKLISVYTYGNIVYSEYARKGFFELCQIAFINLAICLVCKKIYKNQTCKIFKAMFITLSIQTIILMGISTAKLLLYISVYGITIKRIYAGWALLVVFIVFILLLISQFKKINYIKYSFFATVVTLIILTFALPTNICAKYHYNQYLQGNTTISKFVYDTEDCRGSSLKYINMALTDIKTLDNSFAFSNTYRYNKYKHSSAIYKYTTYCFDVENNIKYYDDILLLRKEQ